LKRINAPLDNPDINADAFEIIHRRYGETSLRPLVVIFFTMIIFIDFKRKEGKVW
jgi:hypothetical protein